VQPKIYHASDYDLDISLIDPDAIHIIKRLKEAGFIAYLVGGSVRDLLIKKQPKDYDISTSALPEQIKKVFNKNCLLIGRRFRLAHIRFGHRIFEVSTFRSGENDSDLIVRDNSWGTPEEDVLRRDFTINGLFFDPFEHIIIDYVGGWSDIHNNILKAIGEPVTRFKQDPVRMIRLLKFQSRFDFHVEQNTSTALIKCIHEITKSSPARILEEILKMLESGASEPFFRLMESSGLLDQLFPCLDHFLKGKFGEDVYKLLKVADQINSGNRKDLLERPVLLACLLYPILERELDVVFLSENKIPQYGDVMMLTSSLIKGFIISSFAHFPKRLSAETAYILSTQYHLTPPQGKKHTRTRVAQQKEFDMALKFLDIRSQADSKHAEQFEWWSHQKRHFERHGHKRHPGPGQKEHH